MTHRLLWGLYAALAMAGLAEAAEPTPLAPAQMTLKARIGGGNLVTHLAGPQTEQMYQALAGIGAPLGRMNSYGWRLVNRLLTPQDFDAAMLQAHKHGITPVILLEYEGSYQFLNPPQPIGSRDDWFRAGRAYAKRFRPNGDFGREHGIADWGATIFTAINEPDVQATIPPADYHDALAGLADGIHSIDPALKVVPGGFATCNSHGDATLRGYGPAIADLLDDGRLDGLDLHTYYNDRWFPLTKDKYFSAQSCFDRVKAALKLTRDIRFYATEYNIARDAGWNDPKLLANLFLTAFWDEVGVVGNDRKTSVSVLAFPWNLGDTGRLDGPTYAMASAEAPWQPDERAKVLQMVVKLAGDMVFTALDPLTTGTFALSGPSGDLHVWQNRPGWTDRPGPRWDLGVPEWAREAQLWGWNGLLQTAKPVAGRVVFADLPGNQTYMVLLPRPKR